ncbi:MAG: serine hydrolase domain-containing protein [Bacteroidota bacterium]
MKHKNYLNKISVIFCLGLTLNILPLGAQVNSGDLQVGKTLPRVLGLKDIHRYNLELEKGQFALLDIKQNGIDVIVHTFSPEGKEIESFDSPNGNDGHEMVLVDAAEEGTYQIEVRALGEDKKRKSGKYQIQLVSVQNNISEHLNITLSTLYGRGFIPGFGVTILNERSLLYQRTQGYANLEKQQPYTTKTVQNIASISKTFIGISLMQLVAQGKFTMDTPINQLLPFPVNNPHFPNQPITVGHLATHTSTIKEDDFYEAAYLVDENASIDQYVYHKAFAKAFRKAQKNEAMPLGDFLKAHLSEEGKAYKRANFFKEIPGNNWYYSNVGAALAAYIVETVSGMSYATYVTENILHPLELESAGWYGQGRNDFEVTQQYDFKGNPLPKKTIITYPDGEIYMNILDLSKYLMTFMNASKGLDTGVLNSDVLQKMMEVQHQQVGGRFDGRKDGFFWEFRSGEVMGHSGGDYGVSALMYFHPKSGLGFTYLCNMMPLESDYSNAMSRSIWAAVKRYAPYFVAP